jgi:serralysin
MFITIVHELGHALGLAHPHDGGEEPGRTVFPDQDQDQDVFTVMSYNPGWSGQPPPTNLTFGMQRGLGTFDIAALQALYGKNTTTRSSDTTYELPQANHQGTGWSSIWDTGGNDTISAEGSESAAFINLNEAPLSGKYAGGLLSTIAGIAGGFTIARGVDIENAIGGDGGDKVIGNTLDNNLQGGAGNDQIVGRKGDDTLEGDRGKDELQGDAGDDRFLFRNTIDSSKKGGEDTIADFSHADHDMIDLRSLNGAGKLAFVGTQEFEGKGGEVRYTHDSGNTLVQVDTDSDGTANMEIVLAGNLHLMKRDFML